MRAGLDALRDWSPSQRALRLVVLVGPVVVVLLAGPAGHAPPVWLVLVVAALAAASARTPESGWGALALGAAVVWWCLVPGAGLGAMVLPAAAAVVATHVAGVLAAYGPPEALVSTALVRRWVVRGALALLAAPALWLPARLLRGSPGPDGIWVSSMIAVLLALVLGSLALVVREGE